MHCLGDGNKLKVTKQEKVCFKMGSYEDQVLCNVIPLDASHILLGRPWQYDRDVFHRGKTNGYEPKYNGKKITLKPMSMKVRLMQTNKGRSQVLRYWPLRRK